MPSINIKIVYKKPRPRLESHGIAINNTALSDLINLTQTYLSADTREAFARAMNSQIGPYTTYTYKTEILEGLHIIHQHFIHPDTSESEKAAHHHAAHTFCQMSHE
ncbi:MAG: hypothetical protein NTU48_03990 [Legionellales bacterium]|jgi:hypothetical protein|nr:hypothetical protein [Legionellales bacterium]